MKVNLKKVIFFVIAAGLIAVISSLVSFAETEEYINPADVWVEKDNTTEEFDANAAKIQETRFCSVCGQETTATVYYVPEYATSTAANRSVKWSDGTCEDGVSKGDLKKRNPKYSSTTYTNHHWVKTVCDTCGTINSEHGESYYSFSKDIYELGQCDDESRQDFEINKYSVYDSEKHTVDILRGTYCIHCKGAAANKYNSRQSHELVGTKEDKNGGFHFSGKCDKCGYIVNATYDLLSVMNNYAGKADGMSHGITQTKIAEDPTKLVPRYYADAGNQELYSSPKYTEPGFYSVHYRVLYVLPNGRFFDYGIGYVWIYNADDEKITGADHIHDYEYTETVLPTCTKGYEIFTCKTCGDIMKSYSYFDNVQLDEHEYESRIIEPTENTDGYTEHVCRVCNDTYKTDFTERTGDKYIRFLREGNNISAELIFKNTNPPADLQLIVAYKENDILKHVQMPALTNLKASFTIPDRLKDCDITAFVWDSNMKPLMNVQPFNIQ